MVNTKALQALDNLKWLIIELGLQDYAVINFKMLPKPIVIIDCAYDQKTGTKGEYDYYENTNYVLMWKTH